MKSNVKATKNGFTYRGFDIDQNFKTITKNGVKRAKSEANRYGDRIAWFIAEIECIAWKDEQDNKHKNLKW